MGENQFTRGPLVCRKKLFEDDIQYEADLNKYVDKDAEMLEDIESGEEAESAWKPSPSSSIATKDRSYYDPTELSDWESDQSMEEAKQSEEESDPSMLKSMMMKRNRTFP